MTVRVDYPSTADRFAALVRVGHPRRRPFRSPLVLDAVFGLCNLASFAVLTHWLVDTGPGRAATFGFVAVGVAALLQVQVAAGQGVSRTQDALRAGVLEWTLCGPVRPVVVALADGVSSTVQGVVRCVLYLTLAVVLLGVPVSGADWWGVAVLLLTGTVVTWAICIGCTALTIAAPAGAAAARVGLAALGLISGVFAPLSQLPAPLAAAGEVLPTHLAIAGLRAALAGGPWASVWVALAPTALITLLLALGAYQLSIRIARHRGGLSRV